MWGDPKEDKKPVNLDEISTLSENNKEPLSHLLIIEDKEDTWDRFKNSTEEYLR